MICALYSFYFTYEHTWTIIIQCSNVKEGGDKPRLPRCTFFHCLHQNSCVCVDWLVPFVVVASKTEATCILYISGNIVIVIIILRSRLFWTSCSSEFPSHSETAVITGLVCSQASCYFGLVYSKVLIYSTASLFLLLRRSVYRKELVFKVII